jgi:aspartate/methionine/tyrosine aminotransferase
MKVAKRMHELPRIGLDIMGDLADEKAGSPYRLENADSNIPPPQVAVEATRAAVGLDEYNSWLPLVGLHEMRQSVVDRLAKDQGAAYDRHTEVIITNGVQEGLLSTLLALLDPGDGVITPEPAYSGIINRIRLAHGVPQFVPLVEDRGWRLDLDALARAPDETTKAIVINSTNMPVGSVFTAEEVDAIADLARAHDLWVIDNTASGRMVFDGRSVEFMAARPGMRERTIVLGGVSKEFNLTAWRIGWAVGEAAVIEHVGKAHMYNGTLTSAFAQVGVCAFLNDDEAYRSHTRKCIDILQERRDVVVDGINAIPGLSCARPEGGWWLLVNHGAVEPDPGRFAHQVLERVNVAMTPMHTWGPNTSARHVRIIYANEEAERLAEAVGLIGQAVGDLYPQ